MMTLAVCNNGGIILRHQCPNAKIVAYRQPPIAINKVKANTKLKTHTLPNKNLTRKTPEIWRRQKLRKSSARGVAEVEQAPLPEPKSTNES